MIISESMICYEGGREFFYHKIFREVITEIDRFANF